MSYTRFEPEGSSSGRRLYVQLGYVTFCLINCCMQNAPYPNCIYSRLPEGETSGLKRVEVIKS
jgi:hypothetical protein